MDWMGSFIRMWRRDWGGMGGEDKRSAWFCCDKKSISVVESSIVPLSFWNSKRGSR